MRPDQANYLRGLVRRDIKRRRVRVAALGLRRKDLSLREHEKAIAYAEDVYRSLGGDPSEIAVHS